MHKAGRQICPSCRSSRIEPFYCLQNVPVHSIFLIPTRREAIDYPTGDILLGLCKDCGFISNIAFDPELLNYSEKCEETQGFSPTFNSFHHRLAKHLVDRYDLRNKHIVEIGCGKGEFLTLLCELGNNSGLGFDPVYVEQRNKSQAKNRITFIKDFFSDKYTELKADFICCKMTMEHIHDTADFLDSVRRSIGDNSDTIAFFQIPDALRVFGQIAFWDIYYEHCSYFTAQSLISLFRNCGFEVLSLRRDYNDQYLMIEARPATQRVIPDPTEQLDMQESANSVKHFEENYQLKLEKWKHFLQDIGLMRKRAVLWGSGSKAVSFLTTLRVYDTIEYVVDINPYRQGTFSAGSGQEIVAPDFLTTYQPHIVIVMNAVYEKEIQQSLIDMGINAQLITIDNFFKVE